MVAVSPLVYALALLSASMWGILPILIKRGLIAGGSSRLASFVVATVGAAGYWIGLLFLRGPGALSDVAVSTVGVFAVAGAIGAVAWVASFAGVDRVGASVNSAGFNVHPLFATVLALVWLGEALGPLTIVGIVVLIGGLVVLALSRGGDIAGWRTVELLFPLTAAAAYGTANVVRRFGLTTTPITTLEAITINATMSVLVLLAYLLVYHRNALRPDERTPIVYFVVAGVVSAVAFFLLFEAFDRGSVAIVSALSGTAPAFTTLFTLVLLRSVERITGGVVAGVALVVLGTWLITVL